MTTPQTIPHKRGDTFSWGGLVALTLDSIWAAECKVQEVDPDTLALTEVETLTVTLEALLEADADGNTHTILIEGSATQAGDWPLGKLRCDVKFTDDSDPPVVEHSPTFVINVTQEMT